MHHVTHLDPSQLSVPPAYEGRSVGYRRVSHVDRTVGAVHTGFGTCELEADGRIDPHVHSYEELVYVVAGRPQLTLERSFASWNHRQMNLDLLKRPSPVDAPEVSASMSSALLAYTGITVKLLVDERHGAYLGNMFMVDYHPDAVLLPHDHRRPEGGPGG